MGLNWVEDIVSHLYKLKGYMVLENEDLPMPKAKHRTVRGHSDIDVLAINNKEMLHIECKSWWGPSYTIEQNDFKRLMDRFNHAQPSIFQKYPFLPKNLKVRNMLVTSGKPKKGRVNGPWTRLQRFCDGKSIELVEINTVITDLISVLKEKYPKPARVGKEDGIARFLIHLNHNGFLR